MLSDFIPFLSMAHLYSWQCCLYTLNFRHDSTVMIRPSWFDREVTKQYSVLPWISYRNQSTQSKSYFNGSLNVSLVIQKKKTMIYNLFSFSDNRQYYKGVVGLRGKKRICWITSFKCRIDPWLIDWPTKVIHCPFLVLLLIQWMYINISIRFPFLLIRIMSTLSLDAMTEKLKFEYRSALLQISHKLKKCQTAAVS